VNLLVRFDAEVGQTSSPNGSRKLWSVSTTAVGNGKVKTASGHAICLLAFARVNCRRSDKPPQFRNCAQPASAAHTDAGCCPEVARSLPTRAAPSTRATQNSGIHRKSNKKNSKPDAQKSGQTGGIEIELYRAISRSFDRNCISYTRFRFPTRYCYNGHRTKQNNLIQQKPTGQSVSR